MSPVIVMNIPWSFDAGTPLGAILLIAVTLMLRSEPLARPIPFIWAVHEYSEITPPMSTDLMEPCPALLPFPSQSFSPNTIFYHLIWDCGRVYLRPCDCVSTTTESYPP